jgi:hypothetical protein
MGKPSVERCTRLVGVALLVVAGFSSSMRHAHPGGVGEHDHHLGAGPAVAPAGSLPIEGSAWFAAPLHMHVFVLGFEFTLPAEESSDEPAPTAGEQIVMTRLLGDELTDSAARVSTTFDQVPLVNSWAPIVADLSELTSESPVDTSAAPLCDSARHERSGVQRT